MNDTDENQDHPPGQQDLRSVFTSNLPDMLKQLGISLAVSTYQAGKLILVRREGDKINTHFRNFNRPMGIAVKPDRMSIGCFKTLENYQNTPELIERFEKPGNHDACYVPRTTLETGAIDIHEMAWGRRNTLWGVNTRFSCLCNFDFENSFVPRWRPGFISVLAGEDRCHLNGLAMVDGTPGFVTALGETDTAGGWRRNKRDGGLLMDVRQNKILFQGLSMPHSPRWYRNVLWMLESDCCKRSFSMKHINTVKAMVSFLVLSLFCFVFSPVWAATYTVTSNENSGPGTLRQAILDANDTTEVDDDIVFNLGSGNEKITLSYDLSIYDNLTIDGDNTGSGTDITIDGDNSCRVFYVYGGVEATLLNLTIQNGKVIDADGAGIWNFGTLAIRDCTISNNAAVSGHGGGICSAVGSITIEGTNTFTGNFASAFPNPGDGIYIESGTLSLAEDSFLYMDEGLPLYYDGGDFTENNCTVILNSGATQIINYNITFDNLELSTGTVLEDQDGGIVTVSGETSGAGTVLFDNGGAFTYNGICDQTVFSGNYITLNLSGTDSTKTFADGTTKIGQEISVTDSMTFSGSSSDNVTVQVTVPGTSAWRVFNINASGETVNISNMTIKGGSIPTTNNFGGGIYVSSSILNLDAVIVSGSTAYSGGGIYATSSTITITKSAINGNTATFGGGLYCTASIVTMADATIDGNETSGGSNFGGGGICCTNSSTLMLTRCAVSNNSTALNGGGIYATNTTSTVTLANSTVFHNLSDLSGGGIYNNAALSIENCTIAENHSGNDGSTSRGGGIYQVSGTLDVKNTIIANNYRGSGTGTGDDYYYVGGILTDNQYNVVENQDGTSNQFGPTNNLLETDPTGLATSLSYLGGFTEVVEVTSGNLTTANPGSTSETTDQRGYYRKSGTVYYGDTPTQTTTNTITRGAYQVYGVVARSNAVDDWTSGNNDYYTNIKGAAERESSGAIKLAGTAIYEPGIALDDNETITIQGAGVGTTYVQADATAGTASNRVFNITNGTITLEDMTIRNGNVSGDGGGIYNDSSAELTMNDCVVTGNIATSTDESSGGGICAYGSTTIANCTISGNRATCSSESGNGASAGGIFVTGAEGATIENCTISGNEVSDISGKRATGGGIHADASGSTTLTNCTISGNTVTSASSYGAGFFLESCTVNVKNTIIAQNSDNISDKDYFSARGTLNDQGYNVVEYQAGSGNQFTATETNHNILYDGSKWTDYTSQDLGSLTLSSTLALNDSTNGTYTLALESGSFAIDAIPYADSGAGVWNGAPTSGGNYFDQRGAETIGGDPPGNPISIGAYSEPPLYYQSKTSGNWSNASTWEQSTDGSTWENATAAPDENSLGVTILNTHTVTVAADVTTDLTTVDSGGTLEISTGATLTIANGDGTDLTVNGSLNMDGGSLELSSGATLSYGASSTLIYSDAGGSQTTTTTELPASSGPANLEINNSNGVSLGAATSISGNLALTSGNFTTGSYNFTATGNVTGAGTLVIGTGTVDVNGTYNVTGATTFNGAGTLQLSGTVTTVGTLTAGIGTVAYDGASQTIEGQIYYNLTTSGTGTKTLSGDSTVDNTLTIDNGVTLDVNGSNPLTVKNLTVTNGTMDVSGLNANLLVGGNLQIGAGGAWIKHGDSNYCVQFTGAACTFTDQSAGQNLGHVKVDE